MIIVKDPIGNYPMSLNSSELLIFCATFVSDVAIKE